MYKYCCLNPISPIGLEKFSDDYVLPVRWQEQMRYL